MNLSDKNLDIQDFWVLDFWSTTSAVTLFIIGPVLQIILSRWLPVAILLALAFVLVGHALTGWRHFLTGEIGKFWHPNSWSKPSKTLALSYLVFWSYAAISLLWSPLPLSGMKDIFVLLVAPPITLILATEQSKTTKLPFSTILIVGVSLALVWHISELYGLTRFHRMSEKLPGLHDLNRSAVLLAMLVAPILLLMKRRFSMLMTGVFLLLGYALMLTWTRSQSAVLMIIVSISAAVLVHYRPRLYAFVLPSMACLVLLFPLLLSPIEKLVAKQQSEFFMRSSALIRVEIWKGYRDYIKANFWFGSGIRGNRVIGTAKDSLKYIELRTNKPSVLYNHPHNGVIEYWTDFGLLGMLLVSAVLGAFGYRTAWLPARHKTTIAAAVLAGFSYSMTGAAFSQGWWIGCIVITGVGIIAITKSKNLSSFDSIDET